MSYVIAAPDMLTAAASDVAGIGSSLRAAHAAAVLTRSLNIHWSRKKARALAHSRLRARGEQHSQ